MALRAKREERRASIFQSGRTSRNEAPRFLFEPCEAGSYATRMSSKRVPRGDLDIEISFLEGVRERVPSWPEPWRALAENYTLTGRIEEGLEADLRLVAMCPNDAVARYNLACSLSLTGQLERAADVLVEAIELGYREFEFIRDDDDLQALRDDPVFQRVERKMKEGADDEQEER